MRSDPTTEAQGDKIIKLLEKILGELEALRTGLALPTAADPLSAAVERQKERTRQFLAERERR